MSRVSVRLCSGLALFLAFGSLTTTQVSGQAIASRNQDYFGVLLQSMEVTPLPPPDRHGRPPKIDPRYDVTRIGERGIERGLNFYSVEQEQALGRALSREVESSSKVLDDPVVTEYVDRLGQRLVRVSDAKIPFTIKVLDNNEVNAFALPGGYFYVNRGLIVAANTEAELAGVMAHEIAHVAARHGTKGATRAQLWNIASIPIVFVGGPVGLAIREVSSIAMPMTMMKFSRGFEREADMLGLEYEYAAGYDPEAFIDFLERLAAEAKHRNLVARAFASHPMTRERVRRAQNEIVTMLPPHEQYVVNTSEFDAIKARLVERGDGRGTLMRDSDPNKPVLHRGGAEQGDSTNDDRPKLRRR